MQVINKIRDQTKPQIIQITLVSALIRPVAPLYQRSVTNTNANIPFLRFSSSIMGIMTPILQYLDEEQVYSIKKRRYFSCKESGHTIYDYFRKRKIVIISKDFIKSNSNQRKD